MREKVRRHFDDKSRKTREEDEARRTQLEQKKGKEEDGSRETWSGQSPDRVRPGEPEGSGEKARFFFRRGVPRRSVRGGQTGRRAERQAEQHRR